MLVAAATDFAPKSLQELKAAVGECKVGKEDQKGAGATADSTIAGDNKCEIPIETTNDSATATKNNSLTKMSCAPCKSKSAEHKLSSADFERYMKYELCPSWVAAPDLSSISRTFIARNFQAALDWVVAAGAIAEKQGHHPDLHITQYRQVMLIICPENTFPKHALYPFEFVLTYNLILSQHTLNRYIILDRLKSHKEFNLPPNPLIYTSIYVYIILYI